MIARPALETLPETHAAYVATVPEGIDVLGRLEAQGGRTAAAFSGLTPDRADHPYAPGKWSAKEVLGHLVDVEWVFAYRALRLSRGEPEVLAGMDEARMMAGATYSQRVLAELIEEWRNLRAATIGMLRGLSAQQLQRTGRAAEYELSAAAIAWFLAGHEAHHAGVLAERYGVGERAG